MVEICDVNILGLLSVNIQEIRFQTFVKTILIFILIIILKIIMKIIKP